MNENNNYNFDPMTGQPIQPQQQSAPIQPPGQPTPVVNTYQQPVEPQQPKKKVNTKLIIIIAIAVVVVIAGIIFIPKLFGNKNVDGGNDNEVITELSKYTYNEILDEINILENQYSFNANENVELYMLDEDYKLTLNGKSENKEYYVDVKIYDSFEWLVNDNIYDDTQRANVNYEINTDEEVLFSSLNSDGNIDIVAYGYKLDNQIIGFVIARSNNVERLEISLEDAKTIIYNCKESISSNKNYKTAQDKLMEFAIFGNYMIKDKEMLKAIYKDGFSVFKEYTDEKTNEFIYTSMEVSFNDTDYGLFDFEGDITEEKKIDGFNFLWNDFGEQALIIMTKQDYKYYLNITRNIDHIGKTPSIDESYKIFSSIFEKRVSDEK